MIRRTARLAFVALLTLACDKMISDRFVVTVGSELGRELAPGDRVAEAIRAAVSTCQLQKRHVSSHSNTIAWRDPEHLPGFRVSSQHEGGVIEVRLAQDLMGPVGATDAYECVKGTLRQQLEGAFGKGQVRAAS